MRKKIILSMFLLFFVACSSSSSDHVAEKQGDLDPTFNAPDGYVLYGGWNRDSYVGLAIQANGRIVVSTGILDGDGSNVGVLRYTPGGRLDDSFGNGGLVTWDGGNGKDCGRSLVMDENEKIVLTGYAHNGNDYDLLLMRLNDDGSLDTGFGTGGVVLYDNGTRNDYGRGIALQADGKIVVTARSTGDGTSQALMLRYESDGTPDAMFGVNGVVVYESGGGNDGFRDLALQSDGKIVVAGYTRTALGFEILTARFSADGTLDNSFGINGIVRYDGGNGSAGARGIAILPLGKIIVSGSNHNGSDLDVVVLMYQPDGSPDSGFGSDGVVVYDGGMGNDNGRRLTLQGRDRIVVAGNTSNGNDYDALVLRYNADGTADSSFGNGGAAILHLGEGNDWGEAVAIQTDENMVVAGGIDGVTDDVLTMRLIGFSYLN